MRTLGRLSQLLSAALMISYWRGDKDGAELRRDCPPGFAILLVLYCCSANRLNAHPPLQSPFEWSHAGWVTGLMSLNV